jgi:zona occludens toxin
MLYLFTGLPGSGKTLNAIKFVSESDFFYDYIEDPKDSTKKIPNKQQDGSILRRPVYYHNINGLINPEWTKMDDDQAKKPHEIEKGSIIIYDECQDIFPVLPQSKQASLPDHYSYMNRHRHNGHDVILITQHPKNLNTQLRRLVNRHYHFKRLFGTDTIGRYEYQQCMDEPLDFIAKKEAEYEKITLDSSYFNQYKSAEIHTVKKDIPYKRFMPLVILTILLLIAAIFSVRWFLNQSSIHEYQDQQDSSKPSLIEKATTLNATGLNLNPNTTTNTENPDNYLQRLKPRIDGLVHTAPIYDELTQPKSYPRIAACVITHNKNKCQCYTQQATKLSVEDSICRNIQANGYFDPTVPDSRGYQQQGKPLLSRNTTKKKPAYYRPNSYLIPKTGRY